MLGIFIKTNSSYGESHKTWHNGERPRILQKAIVKRVLEKKLHLDQPDFSHPSLISRQSVASWGKKIKNVISTLFYFTKREQCFLLYISIYLPPILSNNKRQFTSTFYDQDSLAQ